MIKPLISVVMAEYNTNPKHLRESIESILHQSFSDFEFIIIDDGGSNDVSKFVEIFNDKRIKVIKNIVNLGLVKSLNKAIKQSKSELIVRMDTDDLALPNRLSTLYDFATSHPEYAVVGSQVTEFTNNRNLGILAKKGEKDAVSIASGDTLVHPSCLIRKADFNAVGGYPDYNRAEDLALWCEMLLANKRLYVIGDNLLKYRVDIEDYSKRSLMNRKGEISARLFYYPKLRVPFWCYAVIIKSIISGILPPRLVRFYRNKIVLKRNRK